MKDVKAMEEPTDEVCDKCGSPWSSSGPLREVPGLLWLPRCKNTRQLAGTGGEGGPEVHERTSPRGLPQGRLPMVLKKAGSGPSGLLTLSRMQGNRRLVRGEGGKHEVEVLAPIEEKCPDCGSDLMCAGGASGPSSRAATTQPASTSRRRKRGRSASSPGVWAGQVGAKGRWGTLLLRLPALPRVQVHCVSQADPEPCPIAAPRHCWRGNEEGRQVVYCGNEACHYKRAAVISDLSARSATPAGP